MKKLLTTLSVLLIATASYAHSEAAPEGGTYTAERVIDGNIIVVTTPEGKSEKVRLIGIDTPESKPNDKAKRDAERTGKDVEAIVKMGEESKKFLEWLMGLGWSIELEFDVQKRDKYGRLLAYVFLVDNPEVAWEILPSADPFKKEKHILTSAYIDKKISVNATIIKFGYATPMTIPPNVKYADLFKELYEEAREQKRGLWK